MVEYVLKDIIEVELKILQKFDESVNTHINKQNNIIKLLSHKIKDEHIELDI